MANKIFGTLVGIEVFLLAAIVALGKGGHQFSVLLFPLRYRIELIKNEVQREINVINAPTPTFVPRPSVVSTTTPLPTVSPVKRTISGSKTSSRIKINITNGPVPTTDWSWIEQKAAENKAWFDAQAQKNQQDYQNKVNQMDQDYNNAVLKMQQDQEAWKKANGL